MTVVMVLQLIMMIIGAGFGGGADHDFSGGDSHLDAGGHFGGGDSHFDAGGHFGGGDSHFDAGGHFGGGDSHFDAGGHFGGGDSHFDAGGHFGDNTHITGNAHFEMGVHDDSHHPETHSDAVRIFTIRGIVAFFALGGWAGLAAMSMGVPKLLSVMIALLVGVAAMLLASVVIRFALRMQSSGNLDINNAVFQTADVYITIPPSRSDTGKITMLLQDRFVELDAVTDSPEALKPKTKVEVVDTNGKDCLVVRPAMEQE